MNNRQRKVIVFLKGARVIDDLKANKVRIGPHHPLIEGRQPRA
jgi:hypothetical protein